jgi:hypothetical protein
MNKLLPQNVRDIIRDIIRDRHRLLRQKLAVLLYMDYSDVFQICYRNRNQTRIQQTGTKPNSSSGYADRQEKTDQQIRITPQPVMWKPDRVSAILPDFSSDFSESLRENTEPEKDQLSLSQKDMMIKPDINIGHENSIEGISKLLDETNTEVKNLKTDFDQNKSKFDEEKSALANAVNMAKMEKKIPDYKRFEK